ncbi:NUC173 domain-containing protein [Syncephalis fuscata]|nr:NUC173 domain-containing protein [Syncephalis fuscata]
MEALFSKIRTQQRSKLENQQQAATALLAVEATLDEQGGDRTPAAYFAVLFALLAGQTSGKESAGLRAALIYLLSAVFPELPTAVLRHKYEATVTALGEIFVADKDVAPVMRAAIGCLDAALAAQDAHTWTQPLARQAYQALLMSTEAIEHLLATPPPPATRHPASAATAEFCIRVLNECAKSDTQSTIQVLVLAKITASAWPAAALPRLCELLLHLPKLNNTYLTVAALEVFETLFGLDQQELTETRLAEVLQAILQLKPNVNDVQLMPVWLRVVSLGFGAYALSDASACADALPQLFTMIFPNLETDRPAILAASSVALAELVQSCITPATIQTHLAAIDRVVTMTTTGLGYRYRIAWTGVLTIIETLFARLGRYGLPMMQTTLEMLSQLRMEPEFDCKDELDQTIGAAVRHIGIQSVLNVLPLNLDEQSRQSEGGRAWLLPVLANYTANTELSYFVDTLIPMGDHLAQRATTFRAAGREIEWKVYTTLTHQLWHILPGFFTLPTDTSQCFNDSLVERLVGVMQNEPELLPTICTALQLLVEKYQTFLHICREAETTEELTVDGDLVYDLTQVSVENSLKVVSNQSKKLLSALFTVYGATAAESRGYILKVIQVYLTITAAADVNATYRSVHQVLLKVLSDPKAAAAANLPDAATLLDLAIGMLDQLDIDSLRALLSVIMSWLGRGDEPTLQKKAHQILRRAGNCPNGQQLWQEGFEDICQQLIAATGSISAAAKKDRLLALKELMKRLPSHQLNHVPTLLSETILCTKEVNERTRDLAYDLLVTMGYRMKDGGMITMAAIDDNDTTTTAQATLTEYFTMTAAGLAGATPHMISASIAALSRLLFEFKDDISQDTIDQLLETVHVFIVSGNREVVKSALGLVKVAVITLEAPRFQHHLEHLMNALLRWSNDHKGHFKVKVRHIIERLVRKFGYDAVEALMPEKDRKLIVNIKKRRQRAKRRREAEAEGNDDDNEEASTNQTAGNQQRSKVDAYEDALYGSESDLADTDDEVDQDRQARRTANKVNPSRNGKSWIKEDEDTPLDFLGDQVVSQVTGSAPSKRNNRLGQEKSAKLAHKFATSADGRIMIEDGTDREDTIVQPGAGIRNNDDDDDDDNDDKNRGENYYMESKQSRETYTRVGQRIKFSNRGIRAEAFGNDSDGEGEGTSASKTSLGKKGPRRAMNGQGAAPKPLIGQAYRSKKASGDVKKSGRPDPYAYIPLNPLALKKR